MRRHRFAVSGIEYALEMLKTKLSPADRETPVDLITAEKLGGKRVERGKRELLLIDS